MFFTTRNNVKLEEKVEFMILYIFRKKVEGPIKEKKRLEEGWMD